MRPASVPSAAGQRPRHSTLGVLILLVASLVLSGCGDTINGKAVAEPEIAAFHTRLNTGRFDEIYSAAADEFRSAAPREKVTALFDAITRKLGKANAYTTANWNTRTFNFVTTVVIVANTTFERGAGTETFTFRVSGEKAVLVGYNISSIDLMIR